VPRFQKCRRPLEVTFVCTGNRARSPLAEALFRKYTVGVETSVASVGTMNVEAVPALPEAIEAARRLGVDLTGHTARALRAGSLAAADLVVGFESSHVSIAVVEGAARPEHTFLLGELAALLDVPGVDPDPCVRARTSIATADARRVRTRPDVTRVIPDPFGKSTKVMHGTADEIDRLVRKLVHGLFGIEIHDARRQSRLRRARRQPS
jgi:protein-tyrosine phosphatase